ncbi:DUF4126 domain-containing protein [Cellulophaga sp. BC115SP]|uniref:DUF4126 domain-containing protein n=1 Tax=Cellulophaga sp. BC115SP TaxID=2683263 RepID=UPI00141294EC|nr:DUF4126 domain-containing protein [Cellulophaga sp. BC115SP]NBB31511.1 DUF4126 family protein [Cellulophaga sp. BC115SP]
MKTKYFLFGILFSISLLIDFTSWAQSPFQIVPSHVVNMGLILKLISLAAVDFYATSLFIGLALRFTWFAGIPSYFSPLATDGFLMLFGVLYLVEHFVEKIPGASVAWTWAHAIVKPIAVLVFLLQIAFNTSFEISFMTILLGLILVVLISLIDAKLWTVLGFIPFAPVVVTIAEDIIVVLLVSKSILPNLIGA